MSDYTQVTFFAPKDALSTGNPSKLIKGSEVDPELSAISTAISTKYDSSDVASNAEAAALTSDAKLLTPAKLAYALANGTFDLKAGTTIGGVAVPASTTTISAGTGLTGGGDISANRTISLSIPVAIAHGGTGATDAAGARAALGISATGSDSAYLRVSQNLADLASAATARSNLGVTSTGGDTTYAFRANNLSDLANAATARSNLGVTATGGDTTYAFRANNLSDLANAATARSNLGAAAAATSIGVSGTGLSGGGDLSANRTITIDQTAMTTRNITGKAGVTKTLSASAASGGSDGDIWYQY